MSGGMDYLNKSLAKSVLKALARALQAMRLPHNVPLPTPPFPGCLSPYSHPTDPCAKPSI